MKPHVLDAINHLAHFDQSITSAIAACTSTELKDELATILRLAKLQQTKLQALAKSTPHAS